MTHSGVGRVGGVRSLIRILKAPKPPEILSPGPSSSAEHPAALRRVWFHKPILGLLPGVSGVNSHCCPVAVPQPPALHLVLTPSGGSLINHRFHVPVASALAGAQERCTNLPHAPQPACRAFAGHGRVLISTQCSSSGKAINLSPAFLVEAPGMRGFLFRKTAFRGIACQKGRHKYPLSLCRKCGDLEEELKNVTNNLKSLEAASEKVGGWLLLEGDWLDLFFSSPGYSGACQGLRDLTCIRYQPLESPAAGPSPQKEMSGDGASLFCGARPHLLSLLLRRWRRGVRLTPGQPPLRGSECNPVNTEPPPHLNPSILPEIPP